MSIDVFFSASGVFPLTEWGDRRILGLTTKEETEKYYWRDSASLRTASAFRRMRTQNVH